MIRNYQKNFRKLKSALEHQKLYGKLPEYVDLTIQRYIYIYIYTRFTNSTECLIQLAECVLKNNRSYVIAFFGNLENIFFIDCVIKFGGDI